MSHNYELCHLSILLRWSGNPAMGSQSLPAFDKNFTQSSMWAHHQDILLTLSTRGKKKETTNKKKKHCCAIRTLQHLWKTCTSHTIPASQTTVPVSRTLIHAVSTLSHCLLCHSWSLVYTRWFKVLVPHTLAVADVAQSCTVPLPSQVASCEASQQCPSQEGFVAASNNAL